MIMLFRSSLVTSRAYLTLVLWSGRSGFVNYKQWCTRPATDKVYQLLAHGRWFSPGTPASSTTKTGRHGIADR
jgi:hypothetical protein